MYYKLVFIYCILSNYLNMYRPAIFSGIFTMLFLLCPKVTSADIKQLWQQYAEAKTAEYKVHALLSVAEALDKANEYAQADSALDMAIETSLLSANDTLMTKAYNQYFRLDNMENTEEAREYANSLLSLAKSHDNNEWYYYAYSAISKTNMAAGNTDKALESINKAFYYAGLSSNDTLKGDCFLQWGKCLEQTNNKLDAFRNYLNALTIAQKQQNLQAVSDCYDHLSFFYLLIGNYAQARDYKLKQIALTPRLGITDSVIIMNLQCDLSEKYYYNNERNNAEKLTNRIIAYSIRNNNKRLYKDAISNHSTYLLQNGMFKELADYYVNKHPGELQELQQKDSISYYRLMAYVHEYNKNVLAATAAYATAEEMVWRKRSTQKIYLSNFLKRHAQFLLRNNNTELAIEKMQLAFDAAKDANYLPYLIESSRYLDSLYHLQGDIAKAYTYSKFNKQYSDEQQAVTKQDAMLQMEIDNETKQRQIMAELETRQTERRHNLQYMGIVVGIVSCFILLTMLGSFKVSRWVIKSLGFFSFIFFFEFIILLADHKIMEITHHEPWKMLGIKIIIISMLLPFHHWLEHKVIHYLIEHKIMDTSKLSPLKFINRKPKTIVKKEV